MKKINFLKGLLALAISLTLVQCTSDDPIPGPDGINGTNGINGTAGTVGTNGANGDNICLACHNTDYKIVQPATFALSGHALNTGSKRANSCAQCHSHEGYIAVLDGTITQLQTVFTAPYNSTSTLNQKQCSTCHRGGHQSAGVAISGKDAALRNPSAFTLRYQIKGADVTIDYKNSSNACIPCHQPRTSYDVSTLPATSGTNIGKSSFSSLSPHYAASSVVLEGIGGQEIAGIVAYPAKGTSVHRTGASCVSCHMGKASTDKTKGNHTMKPKIDACKTCHTTATDFNIGGGQAKIDGLLLELAEELVRIDKSIKIDGYSGTKTFPAINIPAHATRVNYLGKLSTTYIDPTDTAGNTRMKAYFNWYYINADHSHGVHNPKYVEALLRNSIAALKLLPTMP
jgi:hypothetical protein